MKKLTIMTVCMFLVLCIHAQYGAIQVYGGGTTGYLSFKDFGSFVDSYNADHPTMTKALKMRSVGYGYSGGVLCRLGAFVTGMNVGKVTSFVSTAEFGAQQKRAFRFNNATFDLLIGWKIGAQRGGVIPYLSMSTQSLQIESWYEYQDGIKSYGGETFYSGVWTSWKGVGKLGMRYVYEGTHWGVYADLSVAMNKKEYLGGGFSESSSTTDARYFPAYSSQSTTDAITDGLKENYRQWILAIGMSYRFNWGNE